MLNSLRPAARVLTFFCVSALASATLAGCSDDGGSVVVDINASDSASGDTSAADAATGDSGSDTLADVLASDTDAADITEVSLDATAAACGTVIEGSWEATGACMGMFMTMTLTLEADGCTFGFSQWNMGMSVPRGGVVDGQSVAFTGTGWDTCTGVLSEAGDSVAGECPAGAGSPACEFELALRN